MGNYRTIGEVEEQYLRDHPDEVDDYMAVLFDEYAESGDMPPCATMPQALTKYARTHWNWL
jgi:hypothetical protein